MLFDARLIARGWLAVALASSTDKNRPQLNRTVFVEEHTGGVRLAATDSYMLLHCWVPDIEHDLDQAPGIDEVPISTATVMDPHGRAKGFLAHVLKLANQAEQDDLEPIDVRLRLNVLDTATRGQNVFTGMEARSVILEQPDVERLQLDVYDGTYPAWRPILGNHRTISTELVALNPEIVGRLSKVGKIHPASTLGWRFGGPDRAAAVEIINSEPAVSGVVMPCRWDMTTNQPAHETDDDQGDGDGGADQ